MPIRIYSYLDLAYSERFQAMFWGPDTDLAWGHQHLSCSCGGSAAQSIQISIIPTCQK